MNFSVETILERDGQPVGIVTGWNASDRSLTVDTGSVQLAEDDALSLVTGVGTEIALSGYSFLGVTSGEGVILSIDAGVLDDFVAKATLRRQNNAGANPVYEKIGVITAWDNVTKTLTVETDDELSLNSGDTLWMGIGDDSPILTSNADLTAMGDFAIEAVSGGTARIAQAGYAAGQAPAVGGVAYQSAGGATQAIGTTEAVDGTSLTVNVDDDKTLIRGAGIEATILPHVVLRVDSVDTALSSLSGSLVSGTMQAGRHRLHSTSVIPSISRRHRGSCWRIGRLMAALPSRSRLARW